MKNLLILIALTLLFSCYKEKKITKADVKYLKYLVKYKLKFNEHRKVSNVKIDVIEHDFIDPNEVRTFIIGKDLNKMTLYYDNSFIIYIDNKPFITFYSK